MNTLQIILQFLISGAVVVGATLLSKEIDSKWSGLIVALPLMTLLGFIFISGGTDTATTQKYLLSALLFMIPAAIYILSLYLLYERVSLVTNCLISIVPLAITVFLVQKLF